MSYIAVVGPGAIGCTVGAWLAQDPRHSLTVCARTPFNGIEVETPERVLKAAPTILTDPQAARPVDWVLVATKAYDTTGAAAWLSGLVGPQTQVAVLQNGVEHVERFSAHLSPDRIVPVVVECPAERTAPGRIRQRKPGWMLVPESPGGRALVDLFSATRIEVKTTPDFRTAAWKKLCINSAGAVSALLLQPAGIVQDPKIADVMRGIVRECLAVARAEGANLGDDVVEAVITHYRNSPPDGVNSLHADRAARRPMEVDARNGVIVRLGQKHGLPTPLNAMIVALLEAAQRHEI